MKSHILLWIIPALQWSPDLSPQRVINCLPQRAIKSSSFSPVSALSGWEKESQIITQSAWEAASKIPLWLEASAGWNDFIRAGQVFCETPLLSLVLPSVFFSFSGGTTQVLMREPLGTSLWQSWLCFFPWWLLLRSTKSKSNSKVQWVLFGISLIVFFQRQPKDFQIGSGILIPLLRLEYVTFISSLPTLQSKFLVQFHCFECLKRSWIPVDTNWIWNVLFTSLTW